MKSTTNLTKRDVREMLVKAKKGSESTNISALEVINQMKDQIMEIKFADKKVK
ncbi:hypothetical protein [Aquibacillus saliphilus]|uniref:hypothetical protein n=1 Tax=Aquibacillus saliphilus TaxID=1909422 RepID=UPI001CF002F4|nr:hypothetical protein [Aquibacillus saliphilus]